MKIIVTGGAGFIGSHVVDGYVKAGHKVVILDDFSTGFRRNLNRKAKFYKADICDAAAIDRIFRKERPQTVNHHAAQVSVVESVRDPMLALRTNVLGTANLLQAFATYRPGRAGRPDGKPTTAGKFIFASTGGAIYGNPKKLPAPETTPPNPLSPYALSKMLAESVVKFYAGQNEFPYLILRYSNVFGPRQNPHGEAGVVAIFIDLLKEKTRPVIFGDGTKTRDYVYVGDVARASLLGLKKGVNETVNVSVGKETNDREVFATIAAALRSPIRASYAPFRKGEVRRISPDPRKARKVLGWKPKVGFRAGIRKTVLGR